MGPGGPALCGYLPCPRSELRLELVLCCGQAFRWRESSAGHWTGVLAGRVWTLSQTEEQLWYTVHEEDERGSPTEAVGQELQPRGRDAAGSLHPEAPPGEASGSVGCCDPRQILRDYFQLDVGLAGLYRAWGAADPHFRTVAARFPGVRVLRQDPVECLFSFLCSSNNHLARITGMIERLCRALGRCLGQRGTELYHAFPSLQALAGADVERRLRALGFGYRARFVSQSAQAVLRQFGAEGLQQLRSVSYPEASRQLRTLPGVGAKVADCVCLMALDKAEAVPVDTHVWQIARRDYGWEPGVDTRSVTRRLHGELGDFFRRLWGPYAGWAQAVLFCADLKRFQQPPGQGIRTRGGPAPTAASPARGRPTPTLEAEGLDSASPGATGTLGSEGAAAPCALTGPCHRGASRKRPHGEKCFPRTGPTPQGAL